MISEGFNSLIGTSQAPIVAECLLKVKESYEEIINSIVENLSQQIEGQQADCDILSDENQQLRDRNAQLEEAMAKYEQSFLQANSIVKKNDMLQSEVSQLKDENKLLKKEQKDRDSRLVESKMIIEQLSAS